MKSSLNGRYSHRKRTLVVTAWLVELYCTRAAVSICGENDSMPRMVSSVAVKRPLGMST